MVEPLKPDAIKVLDEICDKWPVIDKDWLQSLARSVIHANSDPLAKMTQQEKDARDTFAKLLKKLDSISQITENLGAIELQALAMQGGSAAGTVDQSVRELRLIFDQAAYYVAGKQGGRKPERRAILIKQIASYLTRKGIEANAATSGPLVTIAFALLNLAGDKMNNPEKIVQQIMSKK